MQHILQISDIKNKHVYGFVELHGLKLGRALSYRSNRQVYSQTPG